MGEDWRSVNDARSGSEGCHRRREEREEPRETRNTAASISCVKLTPSRTPSCQFTMITYNATYSRRVVNVSLRQQSVARLASCAEHDGVGVGIATADLLRPKECNRAKR